MKNLQTCTVAEFGSSHCQHTNSTNLSWKLIALRKLFKTSTLQRFLKFQNARFNSNSDKSTEKHTKSNNKYGLQVRQKNTLMFSPVTQVVWWSLKNIAMLNVLQASTCHLRRFSKTFKVKKSAASWQRCVESCRSKMKWIEFDKIFRYFISTFVKSFALRLFLFDLLEFWISSHLSLHCHNIIWRPWPTIRHVWGSWALSVIT